MQDPEKGLAAGQTTEEAIHILVKSYKSSEISQQVQKEVVEVRTRVSKPLKVNLITGRAFTQCK